MPGDRIYPLPPWWQDRFDELDDRADRHTHWLDDPTSDGFQPASTWMSRWWPASSTRGTAMTSEIEPLFTSSNIRLPWIIGLPSRSPVFRPQPFGGDRMEPLIKSA